MSRVSPALPALVQPLHHRDFRLLWSGQTVSLIGDAVYQVALPFLVLALGGTAAEIGAVLAVSTGVMLVLVLFGGALVDRLPRRTVILSSDVLSSFVLASVAVLGAADALRVEHLYVAAALRGIAMAFFAPAMGAIVPELVPPDLLQSGNALRGLSRQAARISGPVVGGLLVAAAGPPAAFGLDALTFFLSFGLLLLASAPPPREGAVAGGLLREVHKGLAFTFSLPWLWITIFGFSLINLALSGSMSVALPILVRDAFAGDPRSYGAIVSAIGVGEGIGGLVAGQWRFGRVSITMYLFNTLTCVAVAALGMGGSLALSLLAGAGVGLGFAGFGVLWETSVQRHVPRALLGRVTSVDHFGAIMLGPLGPFVTGGAVEAFGPVPVMVVSGAGAALLSLGALLVPSIRRL